MLVNILSWLGLVGVAILFFWLASRAWRLRNPGARWALSVLACLPGLLIALVAGVSGFGLGKLYLPQPQAALTLDTTSSPERILRGEHIARTTCVACHTTNNELPLSGGIDLSAHIPIPAGSIVPPNLTPGGPLQNWSDAEIAQAIRNGRHQNGRVLFAMPATLSNLSDEDVASLVAFLRSQPAVENDTPEVAPSMLIAGLIGAGMIDISRTPVEGPVAAVFPEATAAYGEYVISYQDCVSCHGPDLNGSAGDLGPATPSVHGVVRSWTLEQFIQAMRTGIDPAGHEIQEPMPWQMLGNMDDTELTALYYYLRGE